MKNFTVKPQQLAFLDWEFGVFFHFGIRTFYEGHRDWDMKPMPVEGFAPTALDCEQWIRTARDAGAKYAILVCKHHDGFANWPSAYTEYSVKNTPWKNGQGDVVREFTDACRKYDMKVGLYYSPAQFNSQKMQGREYDDYFINQISELLSNYGKIDYLWFDGCGSEDHRYDAERITAAIRSMQPEILLFDMWDPDTRWCGNEAGIAHMPNRNVVYEPDIANQIKNDPPRDRYLFLPSECDCRMRERNWFYSDFDEHTVKSLPELMGLYEYSVGRGANLLINIGPDRRGLLPEKDAARLLEFGAEIRRRYGDPLVRVEEPVGEDGRYTVELDGYHLIDRVMLKEDITGADQINRVSIYVMPLHAAMPFLVSTNFSVGHKLIATFPPIAAKRIIVEIGSDAPAHLREIAVFCADQG